MEEFITELVPVAEWEWWLWRVTYRSDFGDSQSFFVVSTEDHLDLEVEDRWPSDWFTEYTSEKMSRCAAPRTLWCAARRCRYPESAWDAGAREAARLGFQITDPQPEIYAELA